MYCHCITSGTRLQLLGKWSDIRYISFNLRLHKICHMILCSQCFDTILATSVKMPCETLRSSKHYFRMHFLPRRKQCLSIKNSDKLTMLGKYEDIVSTCQVLNNQACGSYSNHCALNSWLHITQSFQALKLCFPFKTVLCGYVGPVLASD
jgi:hypothetical protein